MQYPWYELVSQDKNILQGDFIPNCPIIIPPPSIQLNSDPEVTIQLIDSIILSQSCDLENDHIEIVLVAPYYSLKVFLESIASSDSSSLKAKRKLIDTMRKGHLPGYHILNKFDGYLADYQVVDFRNVYGINLTTLREISSNLENRVRLLPPYREHLSQSFARYFMRVGLPQDLIIEGY